MLPLGLATFSLSSQDGRHRGDTPSLLVCGLQIAKLVQTAMLLPNDETANPYAFVLASSSGSLVNVLVDSDQLDQHDRCVIVAYDGTPGCGEEGGT